jgi:hypothetical protein
MALSRLLLRKQVSTQDTPPSKAHTNKTDRHLLKTALIIGTTTASPPLAKHHHKNPMHTVPSHKPPSLQADLMVHHPWAKIDIPHRQR